MKIHRFHRGLAVLLGSVCLFAPPAGAQGNDPIVDIARAAAPHPGVSSTPRVSNRLAPAPSLDPGQMTTGDGQTQPSPLPHGLMSPGAGFVSPLPGGLAGPSPSGL